MFSEIYLKNIVKRFIPNNSKLVSLGDNKNKLAIALLDLDGDGKSEIAGFYELNNQIYSLVLKKDYNSWKVISNKKQKGYKIKMLSIIPTIDSMASRLAITWSKGKNNFETNILKWENGNLRNIIKNGMLYPASVNVVGGRKWGYINNSGDFIIEPQYEYAYDFGENNIAIVKKNNLYGIIDTLGSYILQPKYNFIDKFHQDRSIVIDNDGFKIIDERGQEITSRSYNYISTFRDERAMFSDIREDRYLYGYLDRDGKEIIPPKYEDASDFKEKKAIVKVSDSKYQLIDINGNVINEYNYDFVGNLGDGLLVFKEGPDSKYGFIDEDGNVLISPRYTSAQAFNSGVAIVDVSEDYTNKYGLIDKKGDFIIKAEYNDMRLIGENRVGVGIAIDDQNPFIGSKYAIADTKGNFITDFIYYEISNYKNGLISVYDGKNTFFIDKDGKRVMHLPVVKGKGVLAFYNGLIKSDVDYRISYLTRNGNIIWEENTIIPLNNKYEVIQEKFNPNRDYLVYYPRINGMKDNEKQNSINENLKNMSKVKEISSDIQLEYNYLGDFVVEFFKNNLVSLNLHGYEYYFGAAHGMPSKIYAHIDLENGKMYTLEDLFKKDSAYVKIISDIINYEIKNNEEYSYVFPDTFEEIRKDHTFYIDENALYIYFTPYEIAPYAAGFPQFRIPYDKIMDIIDTDGQFWKSFN
ncbi:WG repeat-containing protein [Alkalithermobacter paradoxus]|uniref:KWG leptospira n=1 Tax=Alkalithermobacter paradoxus TaxID=29349 RepID=A0A1V4IAW6_9FIRM|nr:KWG leptospira [[Clostridium] thermoalcaliphilum]